MTLEQVYRDGRLIRGEWADTDEDGRQLLCLLTALADDPSVRPGTCPADLCPGWLAHLLPWFDDAPSAEAWPGIIEECIQQAPHWGRMTTEQSRYLDLYCRRVSVVEAREHCPTEEAAALAAIDRVLALLDRALAGDKPTCDEWAARAAAWAAAWAAREAAAAREASCDRMIRAMLAEMRAVLIDGKPVPWGAA